MLIIIWAWSTFVLVQAYAGNLTALLALPRLPDPIKNVEEFLNQTEISLYMTEGNTETFYFSKASRDSVEGKLYERATIKPLPYMDQAKYGCFPEEIFHGRRHAAICWTGGIYALYSQDFSQNGHCNFYPTEDKLFISPGSMAVFPVMLNFCSFIFR